MALGVLSAFHQHQVPIPGKSRLLVMMIPMKARFYPALTTVSLDLDLQGKEAVRRLLDSGDNETSHTSSILPARLVVRHSTGAKRSPAKTCSLLPNSSGPWRIS